MTIVTLASLAPEIISALIGAAVALISTALIKPIIDRYALKHKLAREYEYEQRKKLQNLIGQFRGSILEAGEAVNHRMWNLYAHASNEWLLQKGNYATMGYYFKTTTYRCLHLLSVCRAFEKKAIFIDGLIAGPRELEVLKFLKALTWSLSDAALFDNLDYDRSEARDHLFRDFLREISDISMPDNELVPLAEYEEFVRKDSRIHPFLRFFDGLKPGEPRYRWDRLVAFHLLIMAMLNTLGYDIQISSRNHFEEACSQIRNAEIRRNLASWLPRLGLISCEAGRMLSGCLVAPRVTLPSGANVPGQR